MIATALLGVVAVTSVAVVVARVRAGGVAAPQIVSASTDSCGQGWTDPRPGTQIIQIGNPGTGAADVALLDAATGAVYGEVDGIGPGTTRPMTVRLGNGVYRFRCVPQDAEAVAGPRIRVSGASAPGGPAVLPVTKNDLLGPLREYQAYVGAGLGVLAGQVGELRDALAAGDLEVARQAWLPGHLTYERLGAAYGAFGAADGAINGRAGGLSGGVADPGFTGFHRIEYGLWHGQSAADLAPVADRLVADVGKLQAAWPNAQVDPLALGLRGHEIMENALQFELTGASDYGSGSGLATIDANLQGTAEVLGVVRPLLITRYPGLHATDAWMSRTETLVQSYRHPDGTWTPLPALDPSRRRALNGTVGGLVERLAPIAAICEPRRTQ